MAAAAVGGVMAGFVVVYEVVQVPVAVAATVYVTVNVLVLKLEPGAGFVAEIETASVVGLFVTLSPV